MYLRKLLVLIVCVVVLLSCYKDGVDPGQLIKNVDVETGSLVPSEWRMLGGDNHIVQLTEQESVSPVRSLEISLDTPDPDFSGYWYQYICDEIPVGKALTLWVMVKGRDITGDGINLVIAGQKKSSFSYDNLARSYDEGPITGTFDWTKYEVKLEKVDEDIACLAVFLQYLPNTTGTVYFDDIYLLF
ncbi:MAG: hypothetical protein AB7O48_14560 [Cyclobacteriaceae bacterium]